MQLSNFKHQISGFKVSGVDVKDSGVREEKQKTLKPGH